MKRKKGDAGFTAIEVLLSIAIISVIAGVSLPVYHAFQTRNDLDVATVEIVQSMRRAEMLARAVDGDTSLGVQLQTGSITLFKGASYAGRDVTRDEVFDMPASITPSGLSEILFTKFTGLPQTTGTTTLTTNTDETRIITINAKGTVSY